MAIPDPHSSSFQTSEASSPVPVRRQSRGVLENLRLFPVDMSRCSATLQVGHPIFRG